MFEQPLYSLTHPSIYQLQSHTYKSFMLEKWGISTCKVEDLSGFTCYYPFFSFFFLPPNYRMKKKIFMNWYCSPHVSKTLSRTKKKTRDGWHKKLTEKLITKAALTTIWLWASGWLKQQVGERMFHQDFFFNLGNCGANVRKKRKYGMKNMKCVAQQQSSIFVSRGLKIVMKKKYSLINFLIL